MTASEAGKLGSEALVRNNAARKVEQVRLYNISPCVCEYCSEPITFEKRKNKFCSRACSVKFSNNKRKKTKTCINCEKELGCGKKYCCRSCQHEYDWNVKRESISLNPSTNTSRQVRRYLLETRGHVCEICSGETWQGKEIPIELDHIDGNHKNNDFNNVRLICPNCHAQTPTYKARNKGNGRHKRRIRYAEGKSY